MSSSNKNKSNRQEKLSAINKTSNEADEVVDISNYYINCDSTNRRANSPSNPRSNTNSQSQKQQQQQKSPANNRIEQQQQEGELRTLPSNSSHASERDLTELPSDLLTRRTRPRRLSSDKKLSLRVTTNNNESVGFQNNSDITATPKSGSTSSDCDKKLVFGLNSRTNRVRHNEYAAVRSSNKSGAQIECQNIGYKNDNIPVGSSKKDIVDEDSARDLRVINHEPEINIGLEMVSTSKQTTHKRQSSPDKKESNLTKTTATTNSNDLHKKQIDTKQEKIEQDKIAQMAKPVKMQFNIPPPPPSKISSNKSSLVSYAKARIYDKQAPVLTSNQHIDSGSRSPPLSPTSVSSLNDLSKSIIAGFKPPKQTIDVRKAREKWEGGEPFAKCKSQQRLAATQAGKKLQLHNSWSMTSLVATQQMQFQQALAANASKGQKSSFYSSSSNSTLDDNMPVKILSRGSVLERVQKFESAPSVSELAEASIGVQLVDSVESGKEDLGSLESNGADNSNKLNLQLNGGANANTCFVESPVAGLTTDQYLSTLQNARRKTLEEIKNANSNATKSDDNNNNNENNAITNASSPQSPQIGSKENSNNTTNGRRLSFRRKSSLNSLASKIPKFYHPNGKPNTYEIELQRRNIVACFDRFPDRKASLIGPNCRKHFHQIAIACGFSEYFKEPLLLYVRHLEPSWSQERASHPMARKQSSFEQRSSSGRKLSITIDPNNINSTTPLTSPTTTATPTTPTRSLTNRPTLTRSISIDVTRSAENQQQQQQQQQTAINGSGSGSGKNISSNGSAIANCDDLNQLSLKFITCDQYFVCWRHLIEHAYDNAARFIHLLTLGQRNYLVPDDFIPLIQSIIDDHPGLKFLGSAPDFHMRYIQTVIARIYFNCNKSWTGKLSQTELRHCDLLQVLQRLSQTDDINEITEYFSYEHFYVIYCKFWSLDQDHDLEISKEDLIRHNGTSISSRIIERIFMGIVSRQIQETGKMGYSDFVWFLIAEEDKKHPRSIEYWFRLMDIDGDGYISMYEMEYFYFEQMKRLELMSIEALPFLDCACQMLDLVNPKEKNRISLSDLKRTKMVTIFYDTFINLEKYLEHESREFVSTRDVVINGKIVSDWDRYASQEYENLSSEDTSSI